MAVNEYVNRVETVANEVLMDISEDTVTESDVLKGKTFHLANGAPAVGTRNECDCGDFDILEGNLPISFKGNGNPLYNYEIKGNNNINRVDESQLTLPISIDTYGGNAEDWEIFGNNNPIVENKTSTLPIDVSATAGNLLDYTIYGNNDIGKNVIQLGESQDRNNVTLTIDSQAGTVTMNGDTTALEAGFSFTLFDTSSLVGGDYIFSGGADGGSSTKYDLYLYNLTDRDIIGRLYSSSDAITVTIERDKRYAVYVQCRKGQAYDNIVFKPMLRPANTTPTFEPYIIGVGKKTKNLLSVEDTAGQNPEVTITRQDEQTGSIEATTTSGRWYNHIYWYPEFEEGQKYILSCYVNEVNEHARLCFRKKPGNQIVVNRWFNTTGAKTMEITYTSEAYPGGVYVSLMLNDSAATEGEINISELMLRKVDTTSDFKPFGYIIPVQSKQRTKNMLEITTESQTISGVTFTVDKEAGTITANGTASANARLDFHTTEMTVNATDIVNGIPSGASNSTYYILVEFENGTNAFGSNLDNTAIGDRPKFTPRVLDWRIYVISGQTVNNLVFKPMIRPADTSPEFEPYYLTNHEDIYIGDSPLAFGQSISNTTEIEVFEGENTIDTTLYNKPEMTIKYKTKGGS